MEASLVTNPSVDPIGLAYPLRGFLKGGGQIILPIDPLDLVNQCPGIDSVLSLKRLSSYTGLFSNGYMGNLVTPLLPVMRIDHVNGKDTNTGGPDAPLKTNAEFCRRVAAAPLTSSVTVSWASYYSSQALAAADPLRLDVQIKQNNSAAQIKLTLVAPTLSIKKSGTLGVVTTRTRATNTPWAVAGTAFDGTDVKQRIRINAGARLGATAIIAKDNTGNNVRTGEWGIPDLTAITATYVTPLATDTYDVLTTNGGVMAVEFIRAKGFGGQPYPAQPTLMMVDWDMTPSNGGYNTQIRFDGIAPCFVNCRGLANSQSSLNILVDGPSYDFTWTYWLSCLLDVPTFFSGSRKQASNYVDGCVITGAVGTTGGYLGITGATIAQGTPIFSEDLGGKLDVEDCGVFDWTVGGGLVGGFNITRGAELYSDTVLLGNNGIWGTSAVGTSVHVDVTDRSSFCYASNAVLFGAGAAAVPSMRLGGRSSVEPFDITANAYAAARTLTYAHLNGTIAGGNFADNAHDESHNCHIFKLFAVG